MLWTYASTVIDILAADTASLTQLETQSIEDVDRASVMHRLTRSTTLAHIIHCRLHSTTDLETGSTTGMSRTPLIVMQTYKYRTLQTQSISDKLRLIARYMHAHTHTCVHTHTHKTSTHIHNIERNKNSMFWPSFSQTLVS